MIALNRTLYERARDRMTSSAVAMSQDDWKRHHNLVEVAFHHYGLTAKPCRFRILDSSVPMVQPTDAQQCCIGENSIRLDATLPSA